MTARSTFARLWRAARLEAQKPISPEYCGTVEDAGQNLIILYRHDGTPCEARRAGTYRVPGRKHWHLEMAASNRKRAAGFPRGSFLYRLTLEDHARHVMEARRQPY